MKYDVIVVGCGYAGAVSARIYAEKLNKKVLIIDKRNTIAGNMYDYKDEHGIYVHKYGPHIAVMNEKKVFDFLSEFTEWMPYEHRVNAEIDGKEVPLPFNLNSLKTLFDNSEYEELKNILIEEYGFEKQVPILEMLKNPNKKIASLAEYIYKKIFVDYTVKMWDKSPEDIDSSVTARIPVRISYDDRHFTHNYQVMPKNGYTELFKKMLDHPNIDLKLNTLANNILKIDFANKKIFCNEESFNGNLVYTGPIDELLEYKFGVLPYRSLNFVIEQQNKNYIQSTAVLNWPDKRPATRRTEMKRLMQQKIMDVTTTITEFPGEFKIDDIIFGEPYYPVLNKKNMELYYKYKNQIDEFDKIKLVGRLAEYKYYNMEAVIKTAIERFE